MKKTVSLFVALVAAALLGGGCRTIPQQYSLIITPAGMVGDQAMLATLQYLVVSTPPVMVTLPNGVRKVQVGITNTTTQGLEVHYCFTWIDSTSGIEVQGVDTPMRSAILPPGMEIRLEDVCASKKGDSYRFFLKLPTE